MQQKATQKRAIIRAPKVEQGEQFQPIRDYWFTTYRELNPFDNAAWCHVCHRQAVFERYVGALHGGAVTVDEFACPNGHVWRNEKVHD